MQVRQVPFRQELGKRNPACCAEDSNECALGASNSQPCDAITTEKGVLMMQAFGQLVRARIAHLFARAQCRSSVNPLGRQKITIYQRINGTDTPGRIPDTDNMIRINKTMKSTRTICPIGAGNGNMPINHQINPNTTR
jgi:hypothetical protein